MGYYTAAELSAKITAIETAITAVLSGQTYSMDTGQGRISMTRASLGELRRERDYLIAEYNEITEDSPGIVAIEVTR